MKNVSHSPVTEMLSGRHKIWLMIGLALLPIADLSACIVLWVFGAAGSYWTLPFLMTVVDLAYLLSVALSNQRFKYAQKLFFGYIAITVVFVIVWLARFASDSEVILTDTAQAACGLLHVVGIVAVAISYLYASRRLRAWRHVQLALAIAFSAVALLALAIIYGVTVIGEGYFGQGHGNLPLVYSYVGDDECEVTDIVYGRGDSVVIPYEFNGRKVTNVSAKVFTYANVKSVTLKCDSAVELCKDISSSLNTNITIYADKKDVDTIKQKLYSRNSIDAYYRYQFELGNNVRPIGLDKDEVYVTFNYDRDSYDNAHAKIIPTWYGKKGDTFALSDIDGVDYAEHSDADSDDDLFYCYNNVGGCIMSELKDGDTAINGIKIDKSRNSVPVRFQTIYKVYAGESNDTKYDTAEHFIFTTANGVVRDYKLTVAAKADELLQPFDRGEAFTRTMQYKANDSSYSQEFTSLSEVLQAGNNGISIAPYWELAKPQITLSRVNSGDIFYGDDYELAATVTHALDGVQIEYEWYDNVQRLSVQQNLQQHASTVGIKTFTAVAKVSAPQTTSCVSVNAAEITVSMLKRPIAVKWRMEGGDVYDGNTRQILNEVENAADGDIVMIKGYTDYGYAGTFTKHAEFVDGDQAAKYTIQSGASYTYTIKPCPVPLTWDEQTEFEYDKAMRRPTAHALDLSGNELVINYFAVNYSGINTWIDAGEYSVTTEIQNTNYTIDDASQKTRNFKITPKPVSVFWSFETLTYNGNEQTPSALVLGVDNETVSVDITGGQINANMVNGSLTTQYTATATSLNKNYTLLGASTDFTINPYGLTVNWTNITVTYNGQRQLPTATAVGVKSQNVPVTVSLNGFLTGAIDANGYTAVATVADTNYVIDEGATQAFLIQRRTVSAVWGSTTLTYNGAEQAPTATAKGVNGENLPLTVSGARKNVGGGTAIAAFALEQQNYTLANTNRSFSIAHKTVTINIENITVEYGETPVYTFTATGIVQGDTVTLTCSVAFTPDGDGNIPAGTYNIIVGSYGADSTNYSYTITKSGTLTVNPKPEPTLTQAQTED